jgi:ABC-type glycerol-3-phosphate transport system permease component
MNTPKPSFLGIVLLIIASYGISLLISIGLLYGYMALSAKDWNALAISLTIMFYTPVISAFIAIPVGYFLKNYNIVYRKIAVGIVILLTMLVFFMRLVPHV